LPIPASSIAHVVRVPGRRADVVRRRLAVLADALGVDQPAEGGPTALLEAVAARLADPDPAEMWLAIAVLGAALPEAPDVQRAVRTARLDGPIAALDRGVGGGWVRRVLLGDVVPDVEVLVGQVLVDLEHTSRTELATGIQRVARMTARRWSRDHDPVLVGWTPDQRALRRLRPEEAARALTGRAEAPDGAAAPSGPTVVVPWCSTYLLPELAPEPARTRRLLGMARYARCRTGVIGFDCVPISSSETTDVGVSESFAGNLAAVRHFDNVVAISGAAAEEYRGWRQMLSAIGEQGPDVSAVSLPVEGREPDLGSLLEMRERLVVGQQPVVLCVGTHEPRKNHLAVLHAAEVLWRKGVGFSLAFIGGHSWNSGRFDETVARLRAAGRPVDTLSSVDDGGLWAAYRVSHCVVFPSLNEGYGLPVAEALACGTPVVTSNFGSMAEIASGGGALLVDPRDDASLVDGLERLLTDEATHSRLRAEAAARDRRSWDDYARETWALLVDEGAARP
jgi:glycosyltransferase involved in cell wall biosynthesis